MSDGNGAAGLVAGVFVMAAVGWMAEIGAAVLIIGFAGMIFIACLGVLAVGMYFWFAFNLVREHEWRHLFDVIAAPLFSGLVVLWAIHSNVASDFSAFIIATAHATGHFPFPINMLLALAMLAAVVFSWFGVPFVGIFLLMGDKVMRVFAYLALGWASFFWAFTILTHTPW